MIANVTIRFDNEIRRIFAKNEFAQHYLLNHERKPVVIKSCCEQIEICERQSTLNFDATKYQYVITELVKFWAKSALKHAQEQMLSRIERQRRVDEANRLDDAKGLFDEMKADAESTSVKSRPTGIAT